MSDEECRKRGWDLFCAEDAVRRLTDTISAVKADTEGYHIVEFRDDKWACDCENATGHASVVCEHVYAAQLARGAKRGFDTEINTEDEGNMLCRYCGSPDINRCGFRYNARGISRRYYCHQCERKFSMRIVEENQAINIPDLLWLLDRVGTLVTRLNELLRQIDSKLSRSLEPKG